MSWRVVGTLAIVAWGVFSFGGVYPWAFVPLFAACAFLGAAELIVAWREASGARANVGGVAAAIVLMAAAIGLQLFPVASGTLRSISPETIVVLEKYNLAFGANGRHPLSIGPELTGQALIALVALAVFMLGSARALNRDDLRWVVRGIVGLGVVVALVGLVQKATGNGPIYGFWKPLQGGDPFGPFVNRNHFAGWMLMAVPLAIGYLCARIARGAGRIEPGWRNRVLWFSSTDANQTILVGLAVAVMASALVLTFSRSGLLGFLFAIAVFACFVILRLGTRARRLLGVAYLFVVVAVAIGSVGLARVSSRFEGQDVSDLSGRIGAWSDAWHIALRFPIAGTGLNTYGIATLFYQGHDLEHHYAQAHNDYLQLAAEGGVLVCVPVVLTIALLATAFRKRLRETSPGSSDYWIRVGALTGIAAIAFQEIGDFSLQMPGNAAFFCLLVGIALRAPEPHAAVQHTPQARPAHVS